MPMTQCSGCIPACDHGAGGHAPRQAGEDFVVFDAKTRRLLGLHVVAPGASDVVQGFALALRFEATVDDLAASHHAFPTIGQGIKAAAEQAVTERSEEAEVEAAAPGSAS